MKQIKRNYYNYHMELLGSGTFENDGVWADGHKSYVMLDEQGHPDYSKGHFAQVRHDNKLVMIRL